VIWLNDAIVRVLNVIAGRPVVRHKAAARSRAFSDASESAEGGSIQMELNTFTRSGASTKTTAAMGAKPTVRPTSERVKIAGQRKHD
jgi:etoposide-induced 2.4 mRNA